MYITDMHGTILLCVLLRIELTQPLLNCNVENLNKVYKRKKYQKTH